MVDTLARVMLDLRRLLDDYDNDNAHVPSGHGPEVTSLVSQDDGPPPLVSPPPDHSPVSRSSKQRRQSKVAQRQHGTTGSRLSSQQWADVRRAAANRA